MRRSVFARSKGKRSGYEVKIDGLLKQIASIFQYESKLFVYQRDHTYKPDWVCEPAKLAVESKGRFLPNDRTKMLNVKAKYPDWMFFLVFQAPNNTLSQTSKTTYGQWADKHGFKWCTDSTLIATLTPILITRLEREVEFRNEK